MAIPADDKRCARRRPIEDLYARLDMIVGAIRRNGISTMKSESCSYRPMTPGCQFVNSEEREVV